MFKTKNAPEILTESKPELELKVGKQYKSTLKHITHHREILAIDYENKIAYKYFNPEEPEFYLVAVLCMHKFIISTEEL